MSYINNYRQASSLADSIIMNVRDPQGAAKKSSLGSKTGAADEILQDVEESPKFTVTKYLADIKNVFGSDEVKSLVGGSEDDTLEVSDLGIEKIRPKSYDDVVYDKTYLEASDVDYQTVADGLKEAAEELGMDVVDLATIVSYETGGTFSPTKVGPTTKWGTHKGLIQFGEPQAEEYGIDWENPYSSQLGKDGAVVKYFKSKGFEPGMGIMDAYSIVNAGAPGRYDWSDEGAGGAEGTVRDKVNKQMSGHKAKARRLVEEYLQ